MSQQSNSPNFGANAVQEVKPVAGRHSNAWSKRLVMRGKYSKTRGGLSKKDLIVNKRGKVVSRKHHERGVALFNSKPHPVFLANISMISSGEKPFKRGSADYKETMELYQDAKSKRKLSKKPRKRSKKDKEIFANISTKPRK